MAWQSYKQGYESPMLYAGKDEILFEIFIDI